MSDKYTVCPTCGAIGQIGAVCEYCGKAINEEENERSVTFTLSKEVIPKRTISRPELAEKVSIFSRVYEYVGKCAIASVHISSVLYDGQMYGIVNLNGDILFPPEYDKIVLFERGYAYLQKDGDCFLFDLMKWKRIDIPQLDENSIPKDVRTFYRQDYHAVVLLDDSMDRFRAFVFDDEDRCIFKFEEKIPYNERKSLDRDEGELPFYFSNEGIILHEPEMTTSSTYAVICIQSVYTIRLTSIFDIRTKKKYAAPQKIRIKEYGYDSLESRVEVRDNEVNSCFCLDDGKITLGLSWWNDYTSTDYKVIHKCVELDFSRPAEEVQTIINEAADKLQAINYAEHGITLKKSSTPSTSGSDSSNSGSGSDSSKGGCGVYILFTIAVVVGILIVAWITGAFEG